MTLMIRSIVLLQQLYRMEVQKLIILILNYLLHFLEGKEYDANKKYKLAIICSSSKDGDKFIGAGGSTLIIDALEVVGE